MRPTIIIFFGAVLLGALTFWNDRARETPGLSGTPVSRNAGIHEDPFSAINIWAKGVIVFDVKNNEILYEKNTELQLPLASLTKVMSALVALETSPDADVMITPYALSAEGDSGLLGGERWQRSNLSDFILMTSSNDGVRALASVSVAQGGEESGTQKTFVDRMNEKAHAIGLAQTFFLNETGLDERGEVSGSYGSAKDVALLFSYIIRTHPELMSATTRAEARISSFDAVHIATNTNKILASIPGLIASKTGFTDLAGGNLAVAFEAGPLRPIIIVVLGSTEEGRFQDMESLVRASIVAISTPD